MCTPHATSDPSRGSSVGPANPSSCGVRVQEGVRGVAGEEEEEEEGAEPDEGHWLAGLGERVSEKPQGSMQGKRLAGREQGVVVVGRRLHLGVGQEGAHVRVHQPRPRGHVIVQEDEQLAQRLLHALIPGEGGGV